MAEKINATLKVYYLFNDTKCLAKGGTVSATPIAPGADVATVDLRSCALAVCSSSPELIGDKNADYSIYTLDATEGLDGDLYEGQGLLSWGLSQPARLTKLVSGFVKPSLSGTVLEVRMKLSQVVQSSQQEFITSMQSFERISRTLPATFDYSNWTEFMKHATSTGTNQSAAQAKTTLVRNPSRTSINTLQRARELAARQTPHSMSAQLKTARQQQSTQQRHARMIAHQAAAAQTGTNGSVSQQAMQQRADSQEGDGPLPLLDPASPQLATPSSPPQMKTFAPPPALPMRSNSMPMAANDTALQPPQLGRFTSTGAPVSRQDMTPRGVKRKASELETFDSAVSRPQLFSPSKAINAAKNSVGAVQQLFKSKSPRDSSQSPAPTVLDKLQQIRDNPSNDLALPPAAAQVKQDQQRSQSPRPTASRPATGRPQRNGADLLKALEEGQPIKYCYNCGNIQTKGNWRQLMLDGARHSLCNACGVYWKTKNKMRPEKLWKRDRQDHMMLDFPARSARIAPQASSQQQTPLTSEADQGEARLVTQTSPMKPGDHATFEQRARATRSSPAQSHRQSGNHVRDVPRSNVAGSRSKRPMTPTRETLQELQVNTPQPQSPSPASGTALEDLVALLQTPKKSFSSKLLSSPSPWRSMFTLLDDVNKEGPDSPSRQKLDKFLEDLGMTNAPGMNFDFSAIANFPMSPVVQGNLDSLASFMSSPPGIFTSSAGLENDNSTPEDLDQPQAAGRTQGEVRTPQKAGVEQDGARAATNENLEDGDSLFTPRKHNTRSRPGSVQRSLRSAGAAYGESMFGGALK